MKSIRFVNYIISKHSFIKNQHTNSGNYKIRLLQYFIKVNIDFCDLRYKKKSDTVLGIKNYQM